MHLYNLKINLHCNYPQKRRGYCNHLCPSFSRLGYLLLNHWTKFNQIWCVRGRATSNYFWPRPLGRGQNVKYHLISITKSISKIFIPNFVCVRTNERYKSCQTGFSFCPLGHAPGVGLWGAQGSKNFFFKNGLVVYQIPRMTSRTECK